MGIEEVTAGPGLRQPHVCNLYNPLTGFPEGWPGEERAGRPHPPDSSGKVYGTGSGYMWAQCGAARLDSQHLGDGGRRNGSLRSCSATGFQG